MLDEILNRLSSIIWGPFVLIPLLLGTGIWLTIRLGGVQFTKLIPALKLALLRRHDADGEPGDVSHYQALATALAATVGVGNIAGVATAIHLAGPAHCSGWVSAMNGCQQLRPSWGPFRTTDARRCREARSIT